MGWLYCLGLQFLGFFLFLLFVFILNRLLVWDWLHVDILFALATIFIVV